MKYLVTGGCGFVGSNIAARLTKQGEPVAIFDNLARRGAAANLEWLQTLGPQQFIHGDIRNAHDVDRAINEWRPDVIFHLGGQVAMTTSMQNPRYDFEVNVGGSLNVLESVKRHCPKTTIVYSSSNKVYGGLDTAALVEGARRYSVPSLPAGIPETAPLDFQTPYGCSKGAADQYMLDYARGYGLNTVVFRHSTIYGGRQFATFDQGWVGWFCQQALAIQKDPSRAPFTISGNGKQVRDLLFVDDAVECYLQAARQIDKARGQAFNIGGGMENSCSLLELFDLLETLLPVKMVYQELPWRHSDQKFFVADNSKAARLIGWKPRVTKAAGVAATLEWVASL
ncbi:MAG: GDP-mannose 4,6-dehydratase [Nibricoccus sp.]